MQQYKNFRKTVLFFIAFVWVGNLWAQSTAKEQFDKGVEYYKQENYTQAVYWYRKAAEQGVKEAQCNLGIFYHEGKGVTKDYTQAVYWLRKAAEQGLAEAQHNLAVCYHDGKGVTKDLVQAVYWLRKAAEQGVAQAQYKLGNYYRLGEGVTIDLVQAVYWYRKAAEQGHAEAQCSLGVYYEFGQGVEKDGNTALYWYEKGIRNKDGNLSEQQKSIALIRIEELEDKGYSSSRAKISNTTTTPSTPLSATYLSTSTTNLSLSATGSSNSISVSTDGSSYELIYLPSWCSISSKTSSSFQIACNANTGDARSDWFKVKSGDKEVKITVNQAAGVKKPSATIENVWTEHNVSLGWNITGMRIHVKFSVSNMQYKQGDCVAYFFYENGAPIINYNAQYKASDGHVCVGMPITPSYESTNFSDLTLGIPYNEFGLRGYYSLKFRICVSDNNLNRIAESNDFGFNYRR